MQAVTTTERLPVDGISFPYASIPRYENDNAGILWEPGETTPEDMAEVKRLVDGE